MIAPKIGSSTRLYLDPINCQKSLELQTGKQLLFVLPNHFSKMDQFIMSLFLMTTDDKQRWLRFD